MAAVLVVDGADICRAPVVEFVLGRQLAGAGFLGDATVASRGLDAEPGRTMCEGASTRLGWSGPAIAFFGAHRARTLEPEDVVDAALVLTAERQHRAAVARLLPGSRPKVFTWKEALVLATIVTDRSRAGTMVRPSDPDELAWALHGARGAIPLIEPAVRTTAFHLRAEAVVDPLTVPDGHADADAARHQHTMAESYDVAMTLGDRLADLTAPLAETVRPRRWWQLRA